MLQALCAVAKKPVRCLRGHGDPVRIKRLANRPIEVLSATLLDKRGYVKSSETLGDTEPMAASDVAFLAPLDSDSRGTLFRDIARRRKIEYPDASMVNDKSILGKSSQTFRENFSSRIRSIIYRYAKRLFDITFSAFILVVALVPGLILATAIAIETKAWPIYSQERIGKGGHPFRIYKFRTMVSDSHNIEKYFTSEQMDAWRRERKVVDDPRITPLGRVLRSTSVDELPNFINVLKGEMSVIGPRAISFDELSNFGENKDLLLSVPAGITGWWQVSRRNQATFETGERQALELWETFSMHFSGSDSNGISCADSYTPNSFGV